MWLIPLVHAQEVEVCREYGSTSAPIVVTGMPDIQSSGVAASRAQAGRFITHDDAGGDAQLHVFERTGDGARYVGAQTVLGATNTDWEDVASGPCPASIEADACLWIGDIGDNDKTRASIDVWVLADTTLAGGETAHCRLTYPDGERFDAEAMFVSPDGAIGVVTKEKDGDAKIFRLDNPTCNGDAVQVMKLEAEFFPGEEITGAAMNADGTAVVIRSGEAAWLWSGCEIDWSAPPTVVDLGSQPQGEAITFLADGTLVSTSEGEPLQVWETPCAVAAVPECPACGCRGSGAWFLVLVPLLGRRWTTGGCRPGARSTDR
ncbi:MAG: hypothetical protein V4850_23300 [Myxococcota bacterium]